MKIKRIIAGLLSVCIISEWEVPNFSAYSTDSGNLLGISDLPDIIIDMDTINEKSYEFTLKSDGTYEISKFIYEKPNTSFQPGDSITLPSSYKGKPITSIGYRAFCTNNADHITERLTIPSSITSIGDYAFWMCKFKSCTIPDTVTSIGIGAFDDTPWLDNMRAQNPLVFINNILIDAKTVKGDIVLPDGLTSIPDFVFYENSDVTGITIPDSVKTIGNSAFNKCKSLERVNIPDSVTEIGEFAFGYCDKLSGTLTIPGSVKTIGSFAFMGCNGITEVVIQDGVTEIKDNAFRNCLSLTDVSIPDSVTAIGDRAFCEARKLKKVVIPAGVMSIGNYCFQYAYALDSVTIKNRNCVIYDDLSVIPAYTVIYGYTNSTAKNYAKKINKNFIALDLGDVTRDGIMSASDVTFTLHECCLLSSFKNGMFDDEQKMLCDVNKDGIITVSDATYILNYVTRLGSDQTGNFPPMDEWMKLQ